MHKPQDYHAMPIDQVLRTLDSQPSGLTTEEAERRLREHGPNVLEQREELSWLRTLLSQFANPLVYVLLVAAGISFAVQHVTDGLVILAIVIINAGIGFIQEFRAERAMAELARLAAPTAVARRSGQDTEIPSADVVPGDVLVLSAGSRVPADARLLSTANLETDESALTGESTPVAKSANPVSPDTTLPERTDMVYAGTVVTRGRGEAVTCATGSETQFGRIAQDVSSRHRQRTPLQNELAVLGRNLGLIALGLSVMVFIVGIARGRDLFSMFLFAIAAAVAAIPEGLPAVVTVALAIGLSAMAKRNAIIRRLPAVEALGSATVIVSDKTGTLTQNKMAVRAVYVPGAEADIDKDGLKHSEAARFLLKAAALANDAQLRQSDGRVEAVGDPTEAALVLAAAEAGLLKDELEQQCPRIDEIPFESERGYMATLNRCREGAGIFVKGAPEVVARMCDRAATEAGEVPLDDDLRRKISEANAGLASQALRVLAAAWKPAEGDSLTEASVARGLVHLGLVGMMDPPRPEAVDALNRCRSAGIRVIMATGDNPDTARAIARELGMVADDAAVISGSEMPHLTDADLERRVADTAVFARVEPEHKLRVVEALKKRGEIVAVTGDGVNDAPALKTANIGVAMGRTGTGVAREAGDMILADDNFATIVAAVEEGRVVFERIQKVVAYLVATNAGELLTITVAVGAGLPLPLTAVQLLWVNLVTDSGPSLALSADQPSEDMLARPPRDPDRGVLDRPLLGKLAVVAPAMAAAALSAFFVGVGGGLSLARTMVFLTLTVSQLFNALNIRSGNESVFIANPFANKWLSLAIVAALALQALPIYVPTLQRAFSTVPLGPVDWAISIALASIILWAAEISKMIGKVIRRRG